MEVLLEAAFLLYSAVAAFAVSITSFAWFASPHNLLVRLSPMQLAVLQVCLQDC